MSNTNPSNPLLKPFTMPPFGAFAPQWVSPAIEALISEQLEALDQLLKKQTLATFDDVVIPLQTQGDQLNKVWSLTGHLNAVVNTPDIRKAYHESVQKMTAFEITMGQHEGLFNAVTKLKNSPDFSKLSATQQQWINHRLRDFRLNGVALPKDKQAIFADLNKALSEYQTRFQDNVMDATDAWHLDIVEESQLKGLPEAQRSLAAQRAKEAGITGWRLTLDYPCYEAVMTYADHRPLRQQMHEAYNKRAAPYNKTGEKFDNSELIEKILKTRHDMAKLLGFAHYAELSLATKMAKSPEQVLSFLTELADKVKPAAQKEFRELCDYCETHHQVSSVEPWDIAYYSEKMQEHQFSLSQEALRAYFPLDKVLSGLFTIVHKLYGITVEKKSYTDVWDPTVQYFEISDKQGKVCGAFLMDLFARKHKQGGAWMDEATRRYRDPQGQIHRPVAYLTCNFRPAVDEVPALLSHEEVLTLFHEFGHCLHHMLTQVEYADLSGIHGVPWDAVECPSQFMENWCWQSEALPLISEHYQTKEPLPESWLKKMLAAKNFQSALGLLRQLEFSLFDFRLHAQAVAQTDAQASALLKQIRSQYGVLPVTHYQQFQYTFKHIFAGGYAAGYYSYLWAEILSQDAFARFKEEGIFNEETGRSFLENILQMGGSVDPDQLFRQFRGRDPQLKPFLEDRGITV